MGVVDEMHVVKITDGLGNQMFQYAFAKKLQMITKKDVFLDTRFINHEDIINRGETPRFIKNYDIREYGLAKYKITLPIADKRVLSRWNYLTNNKKNTVVSSLAINNMWIWQYRNECMQETKNICLNDRFVLPTYFEGYFFNLNYYNDILDILRKEFTLAQPIKLPVYLKRELEKQNTVSIHVRRGDFTRLSRDISEKPYYRNAIEWIERRVHEPQYLVFSDDISWVQENLDIQGKKIYISNSHFADYEEMAIMKHCKHNIIANSTFSYWAAYLNSNKNKIVIYPKNWRKTIIPKEWIGI
ncbi:MAG: alpha-1,2-fucosyltransferase [Lachnospiraceae bacterium]|nr:alpha-1,2-fucosyltransferase [Lachnospiraceae bacterium]